MMTFPLYAAASCRTTLTTGRWSTTTCRASRRAPSRSCKSGSTTSASSTSGAQLWAGWAGGAVGGVFSRGAHVAGGPALTPQVRNCRLDGRVWRGCLFRKKNTQGWWSALASPAVLLSASSTSGAHFCSCGNCKIAGEWGLVGEFARGGDVLGGGECGWVCIRTCGWVGWGSGWAMWWWCMRLIFLPRCTQAPTAHRPATYSDDQ